MAVHGLFLGLNYPGTPFELAGCVNDARDLAALCKPFCTTQSVVLNNKADRDGAHIAVKQLCEKLGKGDVGIITLSSHGTREKYKNRYVEAIVWADSELTYDFELDDAFADRDPGSHLLILADCCHSGGLPLAQKSRSWGTKSGGVRSIALRNTKQHKIAPPSVRRRRGGYYWLACLPEEYAFDAWFDGRANGACSYYAMRAYRDLKPGATYHKWFLKLAGKRPKGYLPSDDYDQQPVEVGSTSMRNRKVPF